MTSRVEWRRVAAITRIVLRGECRRRSQAVAHTKGRHIFSIADRYFQEKYPAAEMRKIRETALQVARWNRRIDLQSGTDGLSSQ